MREPQEFPKEGTGLSPYGFGPFQLDQFLLRGVTTVPITPQSLAVLRVLVANAGRIVSKDELWAAVWKGRVVTDAAITVCIAELRKALGDAPHDPAYIATVHRRGYRFVGALRSPSSPGSRGAEAALVARRPLAGRAAEFEALRAEFNRASTGERRMVVISGGAGMGKTSLVQAFMAELAERLDGPATVGHCVEQHADGDAYLPLLEMLDEIRRGCLGEQCAALLAHEAPAWLRHLPGASAPLASPAVSRERMMLELAQFFEATARSRTSVLVIEDLHWADPSTLAWLDFIVRRDSSCRLLIVATRRDGDTQQSARMDRLVANLAVLDRMREVTLGPLPRSAVAAHLLTSVVIDDQGVLLPSAPDARIVDESASHAFVTNAVYNWSGGVPLFVSRALAHLLERRLHWRDCEATLGPALGPDLLGALAPLIDEQLKGLGPSELALLKLASVCGAHFDTATLIAVQGGEHEAIDAACMTLARTTGLILQAGSAVLPGGVVTSRYQFAHQLYQQVLYNCLPQGARTRLHRSVARAGHHLWRDRLHEMAIPLAWHFESGQLYGEAAELCLKAGQAALGRAANEEACGILRRGIALLEREDAGSNTTNLERELALRLLLGPASAAQLGSGHADARRNYLKARIVARRLGHTTGCFDAEFGLRGLALTRGALLLAHRHGTRLMEAAELADDPELELEARLACANTSFQMGHLDSADEHLQRAITLYQPTRDGQHVHRFGMDPAMFCRALSGITSALRGDATSAREAIASALDGECIRDHPYSLATAHNFAAWNAQLLDEPHRVRRHAAIAAELADRHGFRTALALARIRQGWARAQLGEVEQGVGEIVAGIELWERAGSVLGLPHFRVLLAECQLLHEETVQAEVSLNQAQSIIARTKERWIEAEVWRLRALAQSRERGDLAPEAVSHLRHAISVASRQGAALFARRAASVLSG